MTTANPSTPVVPNLGFAFIVLGASLHDILTRLKAQPQLYPKLDLVYSTEDPVNTSVLLNLPANGIRLRFDGPEQRLRLIEVLDFTKIRLTYKSTEIVKTAAEPELPSPETLSDVTGPTFRHVYDRLFGPTFPGEYLPPSSDDASKTGTYVLSYPGVAFSFPLRHSAWSAESDFVSLLSSSAASPAKSMAIFNGASWPDARSELLTREPPNPRAFSPTARGADGRADEPVMVRVRDRGRMEVLRRSGPPFSIVLSQTTPQDLIAELGPPDAIYRKNDRRLSIHRAWASTSGTSPRPAGTIDGFSDVPDSDPPSANDEAENDTRLAGATVDDLAGLECFYNYFHLGLDVFISPPTSPSPSWGPVSSVTSEAPTPKNILTATKVLLHGNVPGSYPFNRHRRLRWSLEPLPDTAASSSLHSEMKFDEVASVLQRVWKGSAWDDSAHGSTRKGMVLNRGWGDSPGSSCELLGGWEDDARGRRKKPGDESDTTHGLGNTELFGFPGLIFEVLKNGAISCLTVF